MEPHDFHLLADEYDDLLLKADKTDADWDRVGMIERMVMERFGYSLMNECSADNL